MDTYFKVSDYVTDSRSMLQDQVGPPYRYTDDTIVNALNSAVFEMARVRPDVFLSYKYLNKQSMKTKINNNIPGPFSATTQTAYVPIPERLYRATIYYITGLVQFLDVDDVTDVRAQSFIQKFQGAIMTLAV